jgi:hypothetical protein
MMADLARGVNGGKREKIRGERTDADLDAIAGGKVCLNKDVSGSLDSHELWFTHWCIGLGDAYGGTYNISVFGGNLS